MTKFYIEYNPYLSRCIFKKNHKIVSKKSRLGCKTNERLQVLLGESTNWKGLLQEIAKTCDDEKIELTFKGRKIDFEDLKDSVENNKGRTKFDLVFEETQTDEDISGNLDRIFEEIKNADYEEFKEKDENGKDIFDIYEESKNGIFEVSVIATMSSGKSTLINSLLHTELLPSENKACTATIARIIDNDELEDYVVTCYGKDNETIVYEKTLATPELMKQYNADPNVTYIDVEGNVPAISSAKIRLCLRDTPGPNNSRDDNHGKLTNSIIRKQNGIVMYVMNATQFGINDDKNLLMNISSEMKRDGKQSRDRFIFVVNKCDSLDEEKGETLDKVLKDVSDYLNQFGIVDPIIIPTSARLALSIRKSLNGDKLSRMEKNDLSQVDDFVESEVLHFENYAIITPSVKEKLKKQVEEYHSNEDLWEQEALIHTGIPVVEEVIAEYIDKYAFPIKVNDSVKEMIKVLDELDMKNKFNQSIASDSELLERVRSQIAEAKTKQEKSKKVYDDFKKRIEGIKLFDEKVIEEEKYNIESKFSRMTAPYSNKEFVERKEAEALITNFQNELLRNQVDIEERVNREIDNKIYKQCEFMMNDYKRIVAEILDDMEIEGYDFERVCSFEKIKFQSLYDIWWENKEVKETKEKRMKENPEREGFWGFFKVWKPKEIEEIITIKTEGVNVKKIILDVMTVFNSTMKSNVEEMYIQAGLQVEKYKGAFNNNIDMLDMEISKMIEELDSRTKESEILNEQLSVNTKKVEWVEKMDKNIRNLLVF